MLFALAGRRLRRRRRPDREAATTRRPDDDRAEDRPSSTPARRWRPSRRRGRSSSAPSSTSRCSASRTRYRRRRGLRRRDRQDHRRAIFGGTPRTWTTKIEFVETRVDEPRAVHPGGQGRHGRRHLHDQRHPQAGRRLRRPVLRRRPGHHGQGRRHSIKGVDDLNGKKVCSVAGFDVDQERPGEGPAGRRLDELRHVLAVRRGARRRPGRGGHHRQHHPARPGQGQPRQVQAGESTVHRGALRHRREEGRRRFRDFVNDASRRSTRDGDWKKAFDATVGTVGREGPRAARGRPLHLHRCRDRRDHDDGGRRLHHDRRHPAVARRDDHDDRPNHDHDHEP